MNQLQNIFNYQNQQVRVILKDGEPWFVAKDVSDVLGLVNLSESIKRLDADEVSSIEVIDSMRRKQMTNIINEPGLYSLILGSRKPEAKAFKRWITHEVIPSIRKHGAYMTPETIEKTLSDPDFIIGLATKLKEEQQARMDAEKLIESQRHKVVFAEAVEVSTNSILVKDLATLLKQKGINIGQNRLFNWLRDNGYICKKKGDMYNKPTQRSLELGLLELKTHVHTGSNGEMKTKYTPKVTGKGQVYFINKFRGEILHGYHKKVL
ncbi:phage antirepressor [Brevibacillus laterosporus]|uniref:Phage antirepressor n=1 Tax=Brevibacillus halotolerans TaxID=1507437 RepID=A0ABT4HYG6_9BACL|nr:MULTISPECIES: phage antirepressor [Brevibacillus]MCR8986096.1 phage antirepressor [Brevibacillus laterosporus]MCZ0831829.1 phage antirepressor [Brevibacillus halotolerans]